MGYTKESNENFEKEFALVRGVSVGKSVEAILMGSLVKLEETLKDEYLFGKVDKRKVLWSYNQSTNKIWWSVKFGVKKLQSYSAKAENLDAGFDEIRNFIKAVRSGDSEWKSLVKLANVERMNVRSRFLSTGGRKKKK